MWQMEVLGYIGESYFSSIHTSYNDTYIDDNIIYLTFNTKYVYAQQYYSQVLLKQLKINNGITISNIISENKSYSSPIYHYNSSIFYNGNKLFFISQSDSNEKYLYSINLDTYEVNKYSMGINEYGKWEYNPFTDLFYHYTFSPQSNQTFYIFNYKNNTFSNINMSSNYTNAYYSTVLHPNGKIYGIPGSWNQIVEYNPFTNKFNYYNIVQERQSSSVKWQGQVVQFDGNIYQQPYNSNVILEFNPITKEQKYYGNFSGTDKWSIQILLPDKEHIIFFPQNQTQLLIFNYRTKTYELISIIFSQTQFQSLISDGSIYFSNNYSSSSIQIRKITKTTENYISQQKMFTKNDYKLNLYKSNFGMNYIHKLWNIFNQNTNQPIKKIVKRVLPDEIINSNYEINLQFDNEIQNNPYLYEIFIYNLNTQEKQKLQIVNNVSLLTTNNCFYNQDNKKIVFKKELIDSLSNNHNIIIETIGEHIFENVKTISGLSNFVVNSELEDDKTKIQKLFYINPDKDIQHLNVVITSSDIYEENESSQSWIEFSLDGNTWSKSINLGNCNYDEKKEFYIRGKITLPSSGNIELSQFYDINLTVIRDELSLI